VQIKLKSDIFSPSYCHFREVCFDEFNDFSLSLEYYISVNHEDILEFSKVIESCVLALFMVFYTKINFNPAFMAKTSCSCVYRGDFGKSLCVEQRGPPNATISPVLPGGRNSSRKAQKEPRKKKFGQTFPKVVEKGQNSVLKFL
jgi:hypothetical protein